MDLLRQQFDAISLSEMLFLYMCPELFGIKCVINARWLGYTLVSMINDLIL